MDKESAPTQPNVEMEKINTELKNQSINMENNTVKDNKTEAETFREKGNEEFKSRKLEFFKNKFKKNIFLKFKLSIILMPFNLTLVQSNSVLTRHLTMEIVVLLI